jgi:hypothetical protein
MAFDGGAGIMLWMVVGRATDSVTLPFFDCVQMLVPFGIMIGVACCTVLPNGHATFLIFSVSLILFVSKSNFSQPYSNDSAS